MTELVTETRAKLTAAERDALPDSAFALPGRQYPIHDVNHAHAALSEVEQHGTPEEQAKVRAAVHKRYPDIKIDADGQHMQQRPPEWLQRRKRWAHSLVNQPARRSMQISRGDIEVRAKPNGTGGTNFEFRGYGATFFPDEFDMWDRWGDPYIEDVQPGGFTETLSRPDLDVPFLIGHNDAGIPMARTRSGTLRLGQDTRGLEVHAPSLDGRNSEVRNLASAVERGDMDEMSIGFITRGQQWSDDYSHRHLTNVDLHRGDVSVVALAANPMTKGASMVALPTEILSRQAAEERAAMNVAANHEPMTVAQHVHEHENGTGGLHIHAHDHDDDADHDHMHPQVMQNSGGTWDTDSGSTSSSQPHEHRAADDAMGEIADVSDAPSVNPGSSGEQDLKCVNPDCSVHGKAKMCPQCGGPLYSQDGTIVLDDSGVVEEVGGAMADADLLSMRHRLLELASKARATYPAA